MVLDISGASSSGLPCRQRFSAGMPEGGEPRTIVVRTIIPPATFAAVGVVADAVLTAPFERIRRIYQCQGELLRSGRLDRPYKGIFDCVHRTVKAEGNFLLWRGALAQTGHSLISKFSRFGFYEATGGLFGYSERNSYGVQAGKRVANGALASIMAIGVTYSLDYCRIRLANDLKVVREGRPERQFRGLVDCYRQTYSADGVRGLYRGAAVSCLGVAMHGGIQLGLYDVFKAVLLDKDSGIGARLAVGYLTSLSAGLAVYPTDTVRARMLMRSGEHFKYKGGYDCLMRIVQTEGRMALWKGASISIAKAVYSAILLLGFDYVRAQRRVQ